MTVSNFISKPKPAFESSYLGLVDYQKSLVLQNDLFKLAQDKNQNSILGLEHPAVLTLGNRLQGHEVLPTNLPVVQTSRGGLMTIHSEGQLVIYPVLNLKKINWGPRQYVFHLLSATKKLFELFGVECNFDEKSIGLYTAQGKIAFCGIQIKDGISMHGISLNIRNDLELFQQIQACGVQNAKLDRLQNHAADYLTLPEIFQAWVKIFKTEI